MKKVIFIVCTALLCIVLIAQNLTAQAGSTSIDKGYEPLTECQCNIKHVRYRPKFCSNLPGGPFVVVSYNHHQPCDGCSSKSLCWDKDFNLWKPCSSCNWGYGSTDGGIGNMHCIGLLGVLKVEYVNLFGKSE